MIDLQNISHKVGYQQSGFSTSVVDCCTKPGGGGLCLQGFFTPCHIAGKNWHWADQPGGYCAGLCMWFLPFFGQFGSFIASIVFVATGAIANATAETAFTILASSFYGCYLIQCAMAIFMSRATQRKAKPLLPLEPCCKTCMKAWCCSICYNCQIRREQLTASRIIGAGPMYEKYTDNGGQAAPPFTNPPATVPQYANPPPNVPNPLPNVNPHMQYHQYQNPMDRQGAPTHSLAHSQTTGSIQTIHAQPVNHLPPAYFHSQTQTSFGMTPANSDRQQQQSTPSSFGNYPQSFAPSAPPRSILTLNQAEMEKTGNASTPSQLNQAEMEKTGNASGTKSEGQDPEEIV